MPKNWENPKAALCAARAWGRAEPRACFCVTCAVGNDVPSQNGGNVVCKTQAMALPFVVYSFPMWCKFFMFRMAVFSPVFLLTSTIRPELSSRSQVLPRDGLEMCWALMTIALECVKLNSY